jgi:hypothetical protein
MNDAEAIRILDHWASTTYLTWRMQRSSEDHWYCKLDPGNGMRGMRFFCDRTAAGARIKAAKAVASAYSPMPGWRQHVLSEVYGPDIGRRRMRIGG